MKNAILYYYGLAPLNIRQHNKRIKFTIDSSKYVLLPCDRNIEELKILYEISANLMQNHLYCHEFILNNNKEILTNINGENYVLFKTYYDEDSVIILDDLLLFSNIYVSDNYGLQLKRNNWIKLWSDKIDYLEYQINQLGKKYNLIRDSFSYFVGMAETAIMLLQNISFKHSSLVISHKRIKNNFTMFELYNPLNFIIDCKVRDISEFFKERFFVYPDVIEEIKKYLQNSYLSEIDCQLFLARMLFPTFYFDLFEEVIHDDKEEKEIVKIIEKVDSYQFFIKDLYFYFKSYIKLPSIEWLEK